MKRARVAWYWLKNMAKMTSDDCRRCGICCTSLTWEDTYVNLTPQDEVALGKRFVRLHVVRSEIRTSPTLNKTGPLKGVQDCRCVALRGSLLSAVSCSVYERRPDVCRNALSPGDRTCQDAKRLFQDMLEREGLP